MKKLICIFALMSCIAVHAQSIAKKKVEPDCSGGWPTQMAFAKLKNAGLANANVLDLSKTKTIRLASQPMGGNLWHQVYLVTFFKKFGEKIEAIVIHDASDEECSMTDVDIYVVSQHLLPEK